MSMSAGLLTRLRRAVVNALNPATHPTTPNTIDPVYADSGLSGYPPPIPFVGGTAGGVPAGLFYFPRPGDEVLVAHEPTGYPGAAISLTSAPAALPAGAAGQVLLVAGGGEISISPAGAITIAPAAGQALSLGLASSAPSGHETVTLSAAPSGTVVAAPPDGRLALPIAGGGTVYIPYFTS